MLDRLEQEVTFCAKEVPGILPSELKKKKKKGQSSAADGGSQDDQSSDDLVLLRYEEAPMEMNTCDMDSTLTLEPMDEAVKDKGEVVAASNRGVVLMCMPERAALVKSILNFLKKAIPEPTFTENIRTCNIIVNHTIYIWSVWIYGVCGHMT